MLNNIQSIMNILPAQMQSQINMVYQAAVNSGNPEQFLMQRFGGNENFMKAYNVARNKSPEELNNYLGNIYKSMNR